MEFKEKLQKSQPKIKTKSKELILRWNNNYPLDYIYRQKYKIPLFSESHQKGNQINQCLEIYEDAIMKNLIKEQFENKKKKQKNENEEVFNFLKEVLKKEPSE